MNLIVVGSVSFDTVETPKARKDLVLGGTAVFFSIASSYFTRVGMVGAVGTDFPDEHIELLRLHKVDLQGLASMDGKTFHWGGRYHDNMNSRDTLFTHLNVFENFSPELPAAYCDVPYVFLGNIAPALQLHVLDQVHNPEFIALDTMNFWIDGALDDLKKVLKRIDLIFVNDEEAMQLSGEHNLLKATRAIQSMGPKIVVIKKGEHGAFLFHEDARFYAPAFPLEEVHDPTGAGDTFAGGFMGFLAGCKRVDDTSLRQAMIYGSTMASYAVEDFSVHRLQKLQRSDIDARFRAFHEMTRFDPVA
ncbi:MAG TPA: sugar kinase [Bacteroidetes bacterium]|nr:sugar kinase [Bacteroidota bacterium]